MKRAPTDLKMLRTIYRYYYDEYARYSYEKKTRRTKIYVPIDVDIIAKKLGVDGDIVFGRLYYHLQKKYGYTHEDNSKVQFFALAMGADRHIIHFPYLAAVLAKLEDENQKFLTATILSIVSLIVAGVAIIITLIR